MSCMTPELPVLGCPAPVGPSPGPTPTPTPSPRPAATPTAKATAGPTTGTTEPVTGPEQPAAAPEAAPAPVVEVVAGPPLAAGGPGPVPAASPTTAAPGVPVVPAAAQDVPLTSVVPAAYVLVVLGTVGVALLVSFLSGLRPGGGTMKTTRTRLWAGLATIAAAAVVGGVGWYRIAGEPLLNRQVPLLASAGIAVVVLAVLGGALVVAEQLRADQSRIDELEDAVRTLTETLAPLVEQPARRADTEHLVG